MKKFLVFMILALGFAVCFAAPPPSPDVGPLTEIVMPDCEAMPVMVQEITCYLQPAPLICDLELYGYVRIKMPYFAEPINDFYFGNNNKPPDTSMEASLININRSFTWNSPIINHTSGGMPY